jgi:phosphoglycerate kinase
MSLRAITDLNVETELKGKRVLLRCDLNVPIKDGVIRDDGRIRASLPTIKYLLEAGAAVVIMAHLGRPKNGPAPEFSLAPVAHRLGDLLGSQVHFASDVVGSESIAKRAALLGGEVLLLENIRFEAAETSKDDVARLALAKELTAGMDLYISDGFGAVHRKHASVYDVATILPHAAGFLVAAEINVLKKLTESPERPYGVVLGGSKVSDKIGVIKNLLEKVDLMAIGGGMLFTFLAAQGHEIGKSLVEVDLIPEVKKLISETQRLGVKLLIPTDIVVAPTFAADATPTLVSATAIPADQMGLDIGPESAATFAEAIESCKTLFWNGPMGVFEFPNFAHGTNVVAAALTKVSGISVVGGGDSAAAVRALGFADDQFGYISTGGGASLEYLEGKALPGIEVLLNA